MSRPSRTESAELESLENAAALLSAIVDCVEVLGLRIRQAERRALGNPELLAVLTPTHGELRTISTAVGELQAPLQDILCLRQSERRTQ